VKNLRAARRYAEALFETAAERGEEQVALQGLEHATYMLAALPDARAIFTQPLFADRLKQGLVDRVFGSVVSPLVCDFLHIVVAQDRGDVIDEIHERYVELKNARDGILPAQITAAAPMSAEDLEHLVNALSAHSGRQVVPAVEIDEGIIGGVVVRLGDEVIDGSVRGALERMHEQLLAVPVETEVAFGELASELGPASGPGSE